MTTRREVVAAGLGLALSASKRAVGIPAPVQAPDLVTKPIPSSGERIPVVGIGTRNFRWGAPAEAEPLRETIRAFVDGGGRVVDTAPSYGNAETALGALLGEGNYRSRVFLGTKVDRPGKEAAVERMTTSFRDLKTDRVELMQVHNLTDTANQLAAIREWKQAGKVRYVGITTSSDRQYSEFEKVMRAESLDFVQVDYALDQRLAAERILPLAIDRGMAVLVNLPFGRGRLFQAVGNRPLPGRAADIDCTTWAQVFLKYVVSHPAVTTAIPGMTKPHHVVDNLGAARGRMPDRALRVEMERLIG